MTTRQPTSRLCDAHGLLIEELRDLRRRVLLYALLASGLGGALGSAGGQELLRATFTPLTATAKDETMKTVIIEANPSETLGATWEPKRRESLVQWGRTASGDQIGRELVNDRGAAKWWAMHYQRDSLLDELLAAKKVKRIATDAAAVELGKKGELTYKNTSVIAGGSRAIVLEGTIADGENAIVIKDDKNKKTKAKDAGVVIPPVPVPVNGPLVAAAPVSMAEDLEP